MIEYELTHLCSYRVTLEHPPEVIGPVPEGIRVNFYITGGEVSGPRLSGRVRPVGADWLTIRRDGVGELDVRTTIETTAGSLIHVAYTGVADLGKEGFEAFSKGQLPEKAKLCTVPRFRSADPDLEWLNRLQCLSIGEFDLKEFHVNYDVYAVG